MKYSPGTEEYAVLWAIEHIHCQLSFDYDVVVFDTPPTALSLRFLAMPTISNLWIGELSKLRERILSKRESISRINPGSPVAASCVDKADDKVYGKLSSIRQRLSLLSSLFSKESYVSVVINPDKLSVSEALHIKDELIKFNIPLAGLCVNKRGVSEAAWSIDERLATFSTFDVTYLSQGLHDKNDLPRIETQGLVDHFLSSERKG
jgi:arsenite-transporting ATPase